MFLTIMHRYDPTWSPWATLCALQWCCLRHGGYTTSSTTQLQERRQWYLINRIIHISIIIYNYINLNMIVLVSIGREDSFLLSQIIKDKTLFVIVFIITAVDMAIIIVGTSLPETRFNATLQCPDHDYVSGLLGSFLWHTHINRYFLSLCLSFLLSSVCVHM